MHALVIEEAANVEAGGGGAEELANVQAGDGAAEEVASRYWYLTVIKNNDLLWIHARGTKQCR